ncbi:MAG: sialidase family protein [Actinomycetota bacterium]
MTFVSRARAWGFLLAVALIATITAFAVHDEAPAADRIHTGHVHQVVSRDMLEERDAPLHDGISPDPTGRRGAGGIAVAHLPGGVPISSPDIVGAAPRARLFRTGYDSWEPTMGVTKKGVFFNASGNDAYLAVRSTDGGKTWKEVFGGHVFSADPYMFVDQDTDRVFINDYVPPCHLLSFSDDNGESWTTAPPLGCYDNADHQTVFTGPPPEGGAEPSGYKNVVYLCAIGGGISAASTMSWCSKSLDGGMNFEPTGAPAYTNDPTQSGGDLGVPGACNGANGHGWVGSDGTVYLPRGWCGQPWLAISKDEGLTWTRVQVADNGMSCCGRSDGIEVPIPSHEAGVVTDDKGNVFYTWVAGDRLPYMAVSRDGGESWSKPVMIGAPGVNEANLPGIAIGPTGGIAIRYVGTENSPWNGKEVDGEYTETRWNAFLTVIEEPLDDNPVLYSATVNDPSEPLFVGECGPDPIRCGWGDFQDVVIDNRGSVWSVDLDLCADKKNECAESEVIIGRLVGGPKL